MSKPRNRPRKSSGLAQAVESTALDDVETSTEADGAVAGQTIMSEPKPKLMEHP